MGAALSVFASAMVVLACLVFVIAGSGLLVSFPGRGLFSNDADRAEISARCESWKSERPVRSRGQLQIDCVHLLKEHGHGPPFRDVLALVAAPWEVSGSYSVHLSQYQANDPYLDADGTYPEGFAYAYYNDPDIWWMKVLADYGINAYGPSGDWYMGLVPGIEPLSYLFASAKEGQTVGQVAGFAEDYLNWVDGSESRLSMDFGLVGALMADAFAAGNDSVFSGMLRTQLGSPEAQYDLIRVAVETASNGMTTRTQREIILGELEYQYQQYRSSLTGTNSDLEFFEYLVVNADEWAGYYWASADWRLGEE